jgi:diguanylate cyclase (GGDEF)-like protein
MQVSDVTQLNGWIDKITEAVYLLFNGKKPAPLDFNDCPSGELRQLAGYVSRLSMEMESVLQAVTDISCGKLGTPILSRLPEAHALKGLQTSLRHLTWQTSQIAKGDFNQKVDFMGEFSESFNGMVRDLKQTHTDLKKEIDIHEQTQKTLQHAKEKTEKLAQELKNANKQLKEMAFRDGLTGLYNHRYFKDLMAHELNRSERYRNPLSFIMLDLDHFKKINDEYGHPVGDIVLKEVCKAIKNSIRACDIAARYGGEEFIVVLPETELKEAMVVAERLRKTVEDLTITANSHSINVTISVGLTSYIVSKGKKNKSDIISEADAALYQAKKNGRNNICVYNNNGASLGNVY